MAAFTLSRRLVCLSINERITATMARVLFFLALIVAAASAFVSPATNAGEFLPLQRGWILV